MQCDKSSLRNSHINSSVDRPTDVTLTFYKIDVLIEFDYIYYVPLNNCSDGWWKGGVCKLDLKSLNVISDSKSKTLNRTSHSVDSTQQPRCK